MACPKCGCKCTYPHYEEDFDNDTIEESCAACGHIFDIEDAAPEDDDTVRTDGDWVRKVFEPLPEDEMDAVRPFLP